MRAPKVPRIAVDTWALSTFAANHGVHVYTEKLLNLFRELAPQYGVEISPYFRKEGAKNGFQSAPGFSPRYSRMLTHSRLWRFGGAWARASIDRTDLIFNPHCTTLFMGAPAPAVTTIHDVIPVVLPWKSPAVRTLRMMLWVAAKASRAIITVSQYSKKDLVRTYGIPEERIHVVYNGCDHQVFNDRAADEFQSRSLMRRLGIDRPYILHYGAIKPNKNLKRLILAFRAMLERNPNLDLNLVLAGVPDSGYDEVIATAPRHTGERGRVVLTDALDQADLVSLIKGATLAVFPSLYEGFCLPMVETMACGVPTIAADSSCLPEISGGVLRYFNPESVKEISHCMEAAMANGELRTELAVRGRVRAAQFDWKLCAGQTLDILAEATRPSCEQKPSDGTGEEGFFERKTA